MFSGFNLPDGCMDASDIDHYNRLNPPRQCSGCKQEEDDCECCKRCGAAPNQACEPSCGFPSNLDDEFYSKVDELYDQWKDGAA